MNVINDIIAVLIFLPILAVIGAVYLFWCVFLAMAAVVDWVFDDEVY